MIKVFINSINVKVELDDNIKSIQIENPIVYRKIMMDFEEEVIVSYNDAIIDDKHILLLNDPFNINLNDSRLIKALYKNLESKIFDGERQIIFNIENNFFELIDSLNLKIDSNIEYDETVDLLKLFAAFNVKLREFSYETYIDNLIDYIRLYIDLTNTQIILSFNLLKILSNDEIEILRCELKNFNLYLLDLSIEETKDIKSIVSDSDFCIL